MGLSDFQLGVADETGYNTPATVSRFFEYDSESIGETYGRTAGDPLRTGTRYMRNDRFTPYFSGAAGTLTLPVMTRGFGFWLKHMLGASATTGPAETVVYTHTGTEGETFGKSFTAQVNRPFNPSGTNQAFTYAGGKVTGWTLSNSVDANLMLDLECDFASVSTATALATASYPSGMDNFSWAGGVISIGGSAYDVTEFSLQQSTNLDVERRQIRGNTVKKEPTDVRREATFSISADFDSLAQRDRAFSATKAGALASLTATWTGPSIATGATTIFPTVTVTIPSVRFDEWSGAVGGAEAISQSLSGMVLHNGSASPISIAVVNIDTVA